MAVLIKGMEMPTSCFDCNLKKVWDDGVQCLADKGLWMDYDGKHPNCPLIPVPPHGRLIDADALGTKLNKMLTMAFGEGNTAFHFAYRSLGKVVENAPTIIPAEEGEK